MYNQCMLLKNFIEKSNDTLSIDATLQDVIDKMTNERLHHVVIIKDNKPLGILTERDFVRFYANNIPFNLTAIDHANKNLTIMHHTRMVDHALSLMLNNNIRKLIIVDNHDDYIGCAEQEDLIFYLESQIDAENIKLQQMTHTGNKAVMINDHHSLKYALDIMTTNHLTSVLVTSDNIVKGIISESDIIKLAKDNIDQNEIVKKYMHSPIIQVEEYKTTNDMIQVMQKHNIRRVVVFNSREEEYYILTSKDLASTLQGNYTNFIESKFFDTKESFNALSEYIIELVDIDEEQVVFWANSISKANLNLQLDDPITKVIAKDTWEKIYHKLLTEYIVFETIEINNYFYQVRGHYGTISDDRIIKLFLTDITEVMQLTKKLQKELELKDKLLFEQAKMAQMGDMVANIAHQWRQPLSIMTTSATGLQMKSDMDMVTNEDINTLTSIITEHSEYLSKTVDIFRDFLRNDKEFEEVILQDTIHSALTIVNTSLCEHFIKVIDHINDIEPIKVNTIPGEFSQIIINIFNNAKDCLIERNVQNPSIILNLEFSSDNVVITIEDNAGGIPEEILPNIFDPYFTTKEKDKGTGLGLHMSKRIITESLHGNLYVNNTSNGAKFYIELPLH